MTYDHKEYMKNYYRNNKDKWGNSTEWHIKAINVLGGKCVRCGYSDHRALQIDHVDGNGYKDTAKQRQSRGSVGYYRKVIMDTATGDTSYQILCANCNWIKRYENNEHSYRVKQDETS